MISSVNSSIMKGVYQETSLKPKEQEKSSQSVSKQGDTSRIEEIKSSIEKGEYRVDIEADRKSVV